MADQHFMEDIEAFQELTGDIAGVLGAAGRTGIFDVSAQIAALDVFHCDEVEIVVLVPAIKDNEEFSTLRC